METRFGFKGTVADDVFFTEEAVPTRVVIRHVEVEISRQNADLADVKRKLATEVKGCGGNTLVSFKYGQRKHNWWHYVFPFKWDTESWYGQGDAINL